MKILRILARAGLLILMIPVGLQLAIGLPLLLKSMHQAPEMLSLMLGQITGGALLFLLCFAVFRKLGSSDDQRAA